MSDYQAYQILRSEVEHNRKSFLSSETEFLMRERQPLSFQDNQVESKLGEVNDSSTWELV